MSGGSMLYKAEKSQSKKTMTEDEARITHLHTRN